MASLSPEFATQVRDLILCIPDTTPYDTLKGQLITRTTLPEQRRLQQLLTSTELGDQRPMQLIHRMQQLLGGGAVDADAKLLRELFLQRLPGNVRMILASFGDTKTLDELAELGDNIMAAGPPGISGVTQPEPSREVEELRSELSQLRERVSALSTSTRTRSPSPRCRPFRPRSPPPPPGAGTTLALVTWPVNAHLPAHTRETRRPVRRRGRRSWPSSLPLILYHRSQPRPSDTGAQVSVVPPSPKDRPSPNSLTLQAVNGTTIRTYGTRSLTLNLSLRRTFRWIFVVADVANAILGDDFLQHFSLMVDMGKRRLIDSVTNLTVQGIQATSNSPSPSLLSKEHSTSFDALLLEFPTVSLPSTGPLPTKHSVTHHIPTNGPRFG